METVPADPCRPKPPWLRRKLPSGDTWKKLKGVLSACRLNTVCDEARCPNRGECWARGAAAFMILGKICTRSCRFCAVQSGREGEPPREDEGERIARAAEELGLSYAVITSVDRDDLPDKGAGQFALVLRALKTRLPGVRAEVLVPDYTGEELAPIAAAGPDVLAHNVETVRSLQRVRDPRASFDRSLACLSAAGKMGLVTKTSILLGLGERPEELYEAMDELAAAGVDALVLGQYLQPTARQIPPREYISPGQFERYAEEARRRGFRRVISSPFARTSYHAAPL